MTININNDLLYHALSCIAQRAMQKSRPHDERFAYSQAFSLIMDALNGDEISLIMKDQGDVDPDEAFKELCNIHLPGVDVKR